jgi:putative DNA primase/helicase
MSEQPVRRLSAAEITAEAERHIDDYLDGGYDLEAKDVQAAVEAGVDPGVVAAIWAKAKTLRPGKPKAELFICPPVLPEVEKSKGTSPQSEFAAERARREAAFAAKPKGATLQQLLSAFVAKPKEEPEPEPEVEAEPETETEAEPVEAEAGVEAEALEGPLVRFSDEMPKADVNPATLSPSGPYDSAKEYVRRKCWKDGSLATYFWQDQFYEWNGRYYEVVEERVMRDRVYAFLDDSKKGNVNEEQRFRPKPTHVNDMLDGLKSGLVLGAKWLPPMWFETGERATNVLAFKNGLVNVLTGEWVEPTPGLWLHSALEFDWKPDAVAPRWERFLEEIFPGDQESKDFIEEWFGYCMTEETKFQKAAAFIGEPRSGKGTLTDILHELAGDSGYVSLSFHDWLATPNSKEDLIGKRVGVFPDVRFKPGKFYGANYDPGGIDHKSSELLLKITGEDRLTIPRKYIAAWKGRLPMKPILLANDPPNLNDESGVLPTRFIKIAFGQSFLDKEDVELPKKLRKELSGIAVRCLAAYRRLLARGRFIQPKSGLALERDILAQSDAFVAMAHELFAADPEGEVHCGQAYAKFDVWCEARGRLDLKRSIPNNHFGKRLRKVKGFHLVRSHKVHGQPRVYLGIRLRNPSED